MSKEKDFPPAERPGGPSSRPDQTHDPNIESKSESTDEIENTDGTETGDTVTYAYTCDQCEGSAIIEHSHAEVMEINCGNCGDRTIHARVARIDRETEDEIENDEAVDIPREINESEEQRDREAEVQKVRKKLQYGQIFYLIIIIPCALAAGLVVTAIIGLAFAAGLWHLGKQIEALDRHGAAVLTDDGEVDLDRAEELDHPF